ncbi:MAG: hypothetical protein LUG88_01030 [Clostridia bacterium]|nr:hypothetical protein [Clostridia bacterium]
MNRQIKIASLFLTVVFTFMFMISCMDSSADEETNAGASVSGTEASTSTAAETIIADDTLTIVIEKATSDAETEEETYNFSGEITLTIVTESITSETETIEFSVQNGTAEELCFGNCVDMNLYKMENETYGIVSTNGEISFEEVAYIVEAGGENSFYFRAADWYGELESGGEYMLVVEFNSGESASAEFTVE